MPVFPLVLYSLLPPTPPPPTTPTPPTPTPTPTLPPPPPPPLSHSLPTLCYNEIPIHTKSTNSNDDDDVFTPLNIHLVMFVWM